MKNLFAGIKDVYDFLKQSKSCVFIFDFDGTLSPLAKTPEMAFIPEETKTCLTLLKKFFPVAIVSGRDLEDVKQKVGIRGLIYAGSHGFDWEIEGKRSSIKIDPRTKKALKSAMEKIRKILPNYTGAFLEEKGYGFSVHFRLLKKIKEKLFLENLQRIKEEIEKEGYLNAFFGKKVLEFRPKVNFDKGTFTQYLINHFKTRNRIKPTAVYVGDDTTDEDAFSVLTEKDVSVYVGKKKKSKAVYFIANQEKVEDFICGFLKELGFYNL